MRIVLLGRIGSGKDTVANYLKFYGFWRYAFGDAVKCIGKQLFPVRFETGKPRQVLQDLGQMARKIDERCWITLVEHQLADERPDKAVITDCRYANELEWALCLGFRPVWVECPDWLGWQRAMARDGYRPQGFEVDHVSEQFDFVDPDQLFWRLDNSGTQADLFRQVDILVNELRRGADVQKS